MSAVRVRTRSISHALLLTLPAVALSLCTGRSDPAFGDQTYWRGRAWAPQAFLTWLGLQRYADVPSAAAARRTLVAKATRVFLRQLELFGQVNENLDGLLGLGSDSNRADSYYHCEQGAECAAPRSPARSP